MMDDLTTPLLPPSPSPQDAQQYRTAAEQRQGPPPPHPPPWWHRLFKTILNLWNSVLDYLHWHILTKWQHHHHHHHTGPTVPPPPTELLQPYNADAEEHVSYLQRLWNKAFPSTPFQVQSDQWKQLGFQGDVPSRDLRGDVGLLSLRLLVYFAENDAYAHEFVHLMNKTRGSRAEWEYPFAAAAVNLTFMLTGAISHFFFFLSL